MKRNGLIVTAFILCLTAVAQQAPLRMVSQTPVQGAEEAHRLLFDQQGMMWIGTEQGVLRYDGYNFQIRRSDAYSPGILPNNFVWTLAEDHDHRLWIGTHDGIVCYDLRQGSFRTYHLPDVRQRFIHALFVSSDGTVWVGTDLGLSCYDRKTDSFRSWGENLGVKSIAEDHAGHLYVGTWEQGLFRFDRQKERFIGYPRLSQRNTAFSLMIDSRDRLWIGTWESGIVRLDRPADEKQPDAHFYNTGRQDFRTYYRLVEDSVSHAVWGCCMEGITQIDINDDAVINHEGKYRFCNDIQTDGKGNLWVLTQNEGIIQLSTKPSPISQWTLPQAGRPLSVNCVRSLFTTDGQHFWFGLKPYGIAYYDRSSNQVSYGSSIPGFSRMSGNDEVFMQTISGFIKKDDEVWMASSKGVLVWQEGQEAELRHNTDTPYLLTNNVTAIFRQTNGTVWVGQTQGVGVAWTKDQGMMLTIKEKGEQFSTCDVCSFAEDSQGRIWIATENQGIIRVEGDSRKPSTLHYHHYSPQNGNYPIEDALACHEDSHHRLWAISNSGGLFRYNDETDSFEPVNHRYHINSGSVYTIREDAEGALWLTTEQALIRLQFPESDEQPTVTSYGAEDGLPNIRFTTNASFRFSNELFFGSENGFFSISPDRQAIAGNTKPRLVVTNLIINDQPYEYLDSALRKQILSTTPSYADKLTIPSSIEKFTIELSLLTFRNQKQQKYLYMLEGYDDSWHFVGINQHSITFQNLPSGNYRLHLKAADSYGQWTEMPYDIEIRILPPWYKTWWAYLIYLVLLGAVIYGISQWYKQRVNRQARLQQRVSELLHYRELMVMRQFEGAHKALEAEEQQHSSPDELFIQKAIDCVKQHLDDADYDREQFASDMCVSSSTLYNKLRTLTGQNVTAFINSIRLKEACRIARQRPDISVSELSMEVGFNTPKYFTKLFKKEFGMLPSEFIEQRGNRKP